MSNPSLTPSIPSRKKVSYLLRLGVSIFFLNALVMVMVGISLKKSHLLYADRAAVSTQNLTKVLADNIESVLDKIDFCLHSIEREAEISLDSGTFDKQQLDKLIQHNHSFMPELESLRIANAQGEVIIGTGIVKHVNISDRDYFIKLRDNPKGGLVIAQPVMSRMTGKWVLNIARRLDAPDGSFTGVAFAQLSLDYFSRLFARIDIGKKGTVTLRDGDLGFISRYPEYRSAESTIGHKRITPEFAETLAANRDTGTYYTSRTVFDNLPRTLSYRKTAHYPLYVIVGRATSDYLEDWKSDSFSSLILVAVFIITTLLSAYILYRHWLKQIQLTEELRKTNDELELRVVERTAEIDQKNLQLEEINHNLEDRVRNTVAELRTKDKMMIRQGRQAAMGEMIDNIAHQWKQPLNNLSMTIQCVRYEFNSGTMTREEFELDINECMEMISFMSQTIDDFRAFFREDRQKTDFDVKQSIARTIRFVSASLKNIDIKIIAEQEDVIQIHGYPNEYAQVLLNLLGNAREVLHERQVTDPVITVKVTREDGRAVITVSDNGGGIPDDILANIFDLYFTTKELDKGTGIGLFMSKTIIEEHMGGSLTVRNMDGGAQFRIENQLSE